VVLLLFWAYLLYRFAIKHPSKADKGPSLREALWRGLDGMVGWCCWRKKQSALQLMEIYDLDKY